MLRSAYQSSRADWQGFQASIRYVERHHLVPSIMAASACALLFTAIGLLWFPANVALRPVGTSALVSILLAMVTAGYCTVRYSPFIATTLGYFLAIQIGAILGAQAGYLVYSAGASFPLIDAQLYAIDQWLGFDWPSMLARFAAYPLLIEATRLAYDEAGLQALIALPILLLAGQNERLFQYLGASFLALAVVHLVAVFLPAVGVYGYLGLAGTDHPGLLLSSEGRTVEHVLQLRSGAHVDLSDVPVMGLITFPSFHTVMAVQGAWLFWRVRFLRLPAFFFNLLVLIGTVFHGSHHLVDTIAGAAVAVVAIAAARKTCTAFAKVMPAA